MGLLFPSLLLGGAAWLPSLGGVASGPLLLHGAAFLLTLFGGAAFSLLFSWVVLLGLLR